MFIEVQYNKQGPQNMEATTQVQTIMQIHHRIRMDEKVSLYTKKIYIIYKLCTKFINIHEKWHSEAYYTANQQ